MAVRVQICFTLFFYLAVQGHLPRLAPHLLPGPVRRRRRQRARAPRAAPAEAEPRVPRVRASRPRDDAGILRGVPDGADHAVVEDFRFENKHRDCFSRNPAFNESVLKLSCQCTLLCCYLNLMCH
jgi:hypothetical protein